VEWLFLVDLRLVVVRPILPVGLAHRLRHRDRFGNGPVFVLLTLDGDFHGENVFALAAVYFMVRASAMRFGRMRGDRIPVTLSGWIRDRLDKAARREQRQE
jgi:hypothetical protein